MAAAIDCRRVANSEAAAQAALDIVVAQAASAIAARGRFVVALCGGSTPERLYRRLAEIDGDWSRWHLVYGDERCLPLHHPERTSSLVTRCWLSKVDFPRANHHIPSVEQGADTAAALYAEAISPLLPLDMAILGIGEDGHTASLFPGISHPPQPVVPVHDAPKPPPERISLSYDTRCGAETVCFLVTGSGKRGVLQQVLAGRDLPATDVRGRHQTILVTDISLD